jgi:hypothetical protein
LQAEWVGGVGDAGQPGPQGAQVGQARQSAQRPGLASGQVLDLLHGLRAQGEGHAGGGQQAHIVEPGRAGRAGRAAEHRGGADPVGERVRQHRPGVPGPEHSLADPGRRPSHRGVSGGSVSGGSVSGGRPRRRTSPAAPLARARPRSMDTYTGLSPNSAAASCPDTSASVSATTARFRIPMSSGS